MLSVRGSDSKSFPLPPRKFPSFRGIFSGEEEEEEVVRSSCCEQQWRRRSIEEGRRVNFPYLTNNPASIDLPAACKSTRKEGGETPSKSSHSSSAREREGRSSISTFDGAKEN